MKTKDINEIVTRFNSRIATEEEKKLVGEWVMFGEFPEHLQSEAEIAASLQRIRNRVLTKPKTTLARLWKATAMAASIFFVISLGSYIYLKYTPRAVNRQIAKTNDIKPGSNKAFLTLANGKKINLSDALNGKLTEQAGVTITKSGDGKLVYNFSAGAKASNLLNEISTPKGGQHELTLPDGSHVWLNASSSLKFPVNFQNLTSRKVELVGEAYFEIAKDKAHPFIVISKGQEVKVLGTHFNINSYADEGNVKTTLLEGSVQVNNVFLKPNEQSILENNQIQVVTVDAEKVVAWKNGKFVFTSESIESIMRKLSRWYDVEVVYSADFSDKIFTGSISRYDNISKILDKITFTQAVNFKIEGRRITVMP